MMARRIKWQTYWNFMKLIHRLPRKPERKLVIDILAWGLGFDRRGW